MAGDRTGHFHACFLRELAEVRAGIENVPPEFREELRAAADLAERQHRRMQAEYQRIEGIVADISLLVEHALFEVAACR